MEDQTQKQGTAKMRYSFNYGGIDEVLKGDGCPVPDFERLYCSSQGVLIAIPRVIGVHQHPAIPCSQTCHGCETRSNNLVQKALETARGFHDDVSGSLICLVYDPDVFTQDVLRKIISKKDRLARLKLAEYGQAPDFSKKPIISGRRIRRLLENMENEKTRKDALTLLEREVEYFELNLGNYGLTRLEAWNYSSLSDMISRVKAQKSEGSQENGMITDPGLIKSLSLFVEIARKLLSDKSN